MSKEILLTKYKEHTGCSATTICTTDDIVIKPLSKLTKEYKKRHIGDNVAALVFQNHTFISYRYTYENEKQYLPNGRFKYVKIFENELRLTQTWRDPDELIDGSNSFGYFGYAYNSLDCLAQFFESLEDNCAFISTRTSEDFTQFLERLLDKELPDWCMPSDPNVRVHCPENYVDYKKEKLIQNIESICKMKNIHVDLSYWYNDIVSKELLSTQRVQQVKAFEGDTYWLNKSFYHVVYADGYEIDTFLH